MMTRKGFLGAVIGAPWLGWVTKLDVRGEPTLKAIEPHPSQVLQHVWAGSYTQTASTGQTTFVYPQTSSSVAWTTVAVR